MPPKEAVVSRPLLRLRLRRHFYRETRDETRRDERSLTHSLAKKPLTRACRGHKFSKRCHLTVFYNESSGPGRWIYLRSPRRRTLPSRDARHGASPRRCSNVRDFPAEVRILIRNNLQLEDLSEFQFGNERGKRNTERLKTRAPEHSARKRVRTES